MVVIVEKERNKVDDMGDVSKGSKHTSSTDHAPSKDYLWDRRATGVPEVSRRRQGMIEIVLMHSLMLNNVLDTLCG